MTVISPGTQNTVAGTPVSLQIEASASDSGRPLIYTAAGLPSGLSINSATGVISGQPSTPGVSSVTVTATQAAIPGNPGASGSAVFSWTVQKDGGGSFH